MSNLSAEVIGQIALMQSFAVQLPNIKSILNFVIEGFKDIPGVGNISYSIDSKSVDNLCKEFPIYRNNNYYAFIYIEILDKSIFDPYIPYIENFCTVLAIMFEEKKQRVINKKLIEEKSHLLEIEKINYHGLFENSVASVWHEDFSELYKKLEELKKGSIKSLRKYLKNDPQKMSELFSTIKINNVNKATLKLFGAPTFNELLKKLPETMTESSFKVFEKELLAIWNKEDIFQSEVDFYSLQGEKIYGLISIKIPKTELESKNVLITIVDITSQKKIEREIEQYRDKLSDLVEIKTIKLSQSLDTLKKTQDELVEKSKMASLGELVAGIAHEINTPVGILITGTSYIKELIQELEDLYNTKNLTSKKIINIIDKGLETANLLQNSSIKAGKLIKNFKEVAVNETSDIQRKINLNQYVGDIVNGFQTELSEKNIIVNIACDESLELYTYPSSISQIFTNLLSNSFLHGFNRKNSGKIIINININDEHVNIIYKDNGFGMSEESVKKIFMPFYTTTRGKGTSGLGMFIVYNTVVQSLFGVINCKSIPNKETIFEISFPSQIKK